MTIVQLEYLLEVANCGSFSQAADRCFVTQPSLSMQIKNLENELGVVLFDRSKKPVVPTQAGEVVVERAREAILAYNNVRESVNDMKGNMAGTLRIGVIPTVAPYLLPKLIRLFHDRFPKVEMEVREMITADIIAAMDRDRLDAAILSGGTTPERITETEMFDDRFFAYVSPDSPLYERSNVRIEDINANDLLLLAEGHSLRNQVMELCSPHTAGNAPYRFESGSIETLMRIVDATSLMTIIPEMVLPFIPAEHIAQVKTLAKGAASRKIAMAVRRTYAKENLIAALRDTIIASTAVPMTF